MAEDPDPAPPGASKSDAVTPPAGPPVSQKTRTRVLLAFLAAFLVILIAFRAVLFPFLMAIYLAYLIEPAVGWIARRQGLGIRVGRGPAVLVAYAVIVTSIYLLGAFAVAQVGGSVRKAVGDLQRELSKSAAAARFQLADEAPEDVWIPGGTRLERMEGGRLEAWKTLYPAQISEGERETRVLLEPVHPPDAPPPPDGLALEIVNPASLALPPAASIRAHTDVAAQGIEVFTERYVIAPVSSLVEKVSGQHMDPGIVRKAIAEKSKEIGPAAGKEIGSATTGLVINLALSAYQVVLVLMLAGFILVDRRNIAAFFESLPPKRMQPGYVRLMEYVDRGLAGVIRGQLMICLVNGLLTWLGLAIFGIPYAALLGLVAGIFSLIPVFGTIASSVPIVLVALATGGMHAALVALLWICLIHLLEANLLNPLIMGSNAEMHPVIIVFALLAGEHAYGVWGALLAVPVASLIQSGFKYYRHEIEGIPPEEYKGHGAWLKRLLAKRKTPAKAPGAPGGPS